LLFSENFYILNKTSGDKMTMDRETKVVERPLYQEILFTEQQVNERIDEMATEIIQKYNPDETLFVNLPNGALPFMTKLMSAIQVQDPYFHPNVQSMIISRYGVSREPGLLRLVTDLPPNYRDLSDYVVVLLDDLIDEGDTLKYARQHLLDYGAKRVDPIVLVKKLKDPAVEGGIAMHGFEAPDAWLTGMGMDDPRLGKDANRWAGWIAIANYNQP
jgi:hypoxanthine phosphoribosyltransferase